MNEIIYGDLIGKNYDQAGKCYGLVKEISTRMGKRLPGFVNLCIAHAEISTVIVHGVRTLFSELSEPIPGDLVLIRNSPGIYHVGIVIRPGHFIHNTRRYGVQTVSISSPFYKNRIEGFYRYNG